MIVVMVDRIQSFWTMLLLNFNRGVIKDGMSFLFSVCLGTGVLLLKGYYVLYFFRAMSEQQGWGPVRGW